MGAYSISSTSNLPTSIVPKKFLILSKNPVLGILIPLGIFIPLFFFFSRFFSFSSRRFFWFVLASNLIVSLLSFNVRPIIFSIFFVVALIAATFSSNEGVISSSLSLVGCFTIAPPAGFLAGTSVAVGLVVAAAPPPLEGKNLWVLTAILLYLSDSIDSKHLNPQFRLIECLKICR